MEARRAGRARLSLLHPAAAPTYPGRNAQWPNSAVILTRGTFDDLIGTLEAEHLECKARPYQLQHDYQKFELAKDVSMIANWLARHGGEGAHLLLGVRTEKSAERHADEVTAVSPFPQSLVDPKQYYDVLQSWLLPPPEGLRVEWCRIRGGWRQGAHPRGWAGLIVAKTISVGIRHSRLLVSWLDRREPIRTSASCPY